MGSATGTKRMRSLKLNELEECHGGMTLTTALRILPDAHAGVGQHPVGAPQANLAPAGVQTQVAGLNKNILDQLIANQHTLANQIHNQNTASANALAQARAQQQNSALYNSQFLQMMRLTSLLNQAHQPGVGGSPARRSGGSRSGGGGGGDDFGGGPSHSSGGSSHARSGGGHYDDGGGSHSWGGYRENAAVRGHYAGAGKPAPAPAPTLHEQTPIGSGKGDRLDAKPESMHPRDAWRSDSATPTNTPYSPTGSGAEKGAPAVSPVTWAESIHTPSALLDGKSPADIMHGKGATDPQGNPLPASYGELKWDAYNAQRAQNADLYSKGVQLTNPDGTPTGTMIALAQGDQIAKALMDPESKHYSPVEDWRVDVAQSSGGLTEGAPGQGVDPFRADQIGHAMDQEQMQMGQAMLQNDPSLGKYYLTDSDRESLVPPEQAGAQTGTAINWDVDDQAYSQEGATVPRAEGAGQTESGGQETGRTQVASADDSSDVVDNSGVDQLEKSYADNDVQTGLDAGSTPSGDFA